MGGCCAKQPEQDPDQTKHRRRRRRSAHTPTSPYRTEEEMAFSLLQEGKVCVAMFLYEPGSPAECKLEKGDLRIDSRCLVRSEDFVFVRQLKKDGIRGYVATNFLAPEGSVEAEDYYFGPIRRRDAARLLKNEDLPGGAFLVRDSETAKERKYERATDNADNATRYVISVRDCTAKGELHHYRMYVSGREGLERRFYISARVTFERVPELITFYKTRDVPDDICCRLTTPVKRPPPVRKALSKEMRDKWREIPREQIAELKEELGRGHFGAVYTGYWKMAADRNPIEVAIKLLKDVSPTAKEMLFSEAFAMRDLAHKNIVRLYGVISSGEPYAMITELMKDGSLKNYLQQRRLNLEPPLPDAELVDISTQLCRGMAYVESKGVVHRDLASRNILINILSTKPIKVEAKISDFGLAKVLHDKGVYVMARDTPMPRQWMAPEAFNKNQFTTKSDIWAYGATLCEIFSEGDDPFQTANANQLLRYVKRGTRPKVPAAMRRVGMEPLF